MFSSLNVNNAFKDLTNLCILIFITLLVIFITFILSRKYKLRLKKGYTLVILIIVFCSLFYLPDFIDFLNTMPILRTIFEFFCVAWATMATIIGLHKTTKQINTTNLEEVKNSIFSNMYDVLGTLPVGIIISNDDGEIVYINKYIKKLFGYEEEELLNKKVEILLPEHMRQNHLNYRKEYFKKPLEKLMGSGRVLEGLTKNGEIKYLEIALKPVRFSFINDGQLIIAISDVTNDYFNKKTIEKKNQLINVATYGIPSLLSYVDSDGYYQFVNDAYTKYWGKSSEDIIKKHYKNLIPEEAIKVVEANFEKALQGEEVNFKIEINFPNMGLRNLDVFYIPHFNKEKNTVIGTIVLSHDTTELLNAKQELEDKNHQLEEYAFLVSHDLRAPVRHISNFLELLKIELNNNKNLSIKENKYIEIILENSKRIQDMISGMLKLASINQIQTQIDAIEINGYLSKFFQNNYPQIKLEMEVSKNIFVNIDTDLISLVFNNLVLNSIKFSQNNICIINVEFEEIQDKLILYFEDNGSGISQKNIDNIFAAFFKSPDSDGLGLGLNIVKRALEKMNGNIEVMLCHTGAKFKITLEKARKTNRVS